MRISFFLGNHVVEAEKLRVLHCAALLSPPSGILSQMHLEREAAEALSLDWTVKMYCPGNGQSKSEVIHYDNSIDSESLNTPLGKLTAWVRLRRNYHRWLLQQQDQVDIFVLRYYVHDPYQLAFVRHCKKPVLFVHHTLEVPELALPDGVSGLMRPRLEQLLGRPTISACSGVIGVTQEIVAYELGRIGCVDKPTCVYPNGIMFRCLEIRDRRSRDVPEMLFVANFAPWHGLDILLDEVARSDEDFVLHLVGTVPEGLVSMTKDTRIRAYGHLDQPKIVELSQQCWIGLSSFALFRKKMKQACPLKVREYLMLGLPVYGDYQDVFPSDVSYFMNGSGKLEEVIDFCHRTRVLEKGQVVDMARPQIDKVALLQRLYMSLTEMQFSPRESHA